MAVCFGIVAFPSLPCGEWAFGLFYCVQSKLINFGLTKVNARLSNYC